MERAARTARLRALRRGDHMAWVYADTTDRRSGVLEHLRVGLAQRERLFYTADRERAELLDDLRGLVDEPSHLVDSGQLVVCPLDECFRRLDGLAQVDACASITAAALADGWAGLRMAADVTALCADGADQDAFVDAELRLGGWMATSAMTGLCLFDERRLGDAACELTCTHTHGWHRDACFGIRLVDGVIRIEGELDASVVRPFTRVLHIALQSVDGDVVVDASGVVFADLAACRAFDATVSAARAAGRAVELRDVSAPLARASELAESTLVLGPTV